MAQKISTVCIRRAKYDDPALDILLDPLGGMGNFIEKGDKVLLKVNLLSPSDISKAVTTHPELIRAVAKAVRRVGGNPFIGDSPAGPFTKGRLEAAYKKSGILKMSKEENIPLNYDTSVVKKEVKKGVVLKKTPICKFIYDADKIIALPKFKTHTYQYMTLACKIMYGAIPGLTKGKYHAQFPKRETFADMMLDILTIVRPSLYIMDGIIGMDGPGPGNGRPINIGVLLASVNPVAMDIAACGIAGIQPVGVPVLKRAKVRKLWPETINYPILKPEAVQFKDFQLPSTAGHILTGKKPPKKTPRITDKCIGCGECVKICPKETIKLEKGKARICYNKCIRCFCCHEVCPEDAIKLGSTR